MKIEQFVCGLDKAVHTRLFQSEVLQKHLFFLVCLQLGNVRFDAGTYHQHFGPFVFDGLPHSVNILVSCHYGSLVDVAYIKDGFGREQHQVFGGLLLAFVQGHCAGAASVEQCIPVKIHYLHQFLGLGVAAGFCLLNLFLVTVLYGLEVFELKLQIDGLLVANRVDAAIDMRHIVVVETAQHVDDGIGCANVAQKFVAQSFAFGGTFYKAGDVHNLHCGGDDRGRMLHFDQFGQTFIGYGDNAHIGLDSAERKVGSLCFCIAQAVEKGRFPDIGQTHNTTL